MKKRKTSLKKKHKTLKPKFGKSLKSRRSKLKLPGPG